MTPQTLTLKAPGPFGDIPLRLVFCPGPRRGTILHYHGLSESKESYPNALSIFARAGFLAVGVDAIGHGERLARDFAGETSSFQKILRWADESAREVPVLVDALTNLLGSALGRVGLSGVSFGGYVAYAAFAREPRLAALVAILGSPDYTAGGTLEGAEAAGESPHRVPERFAGRPLLAVNARHDQSVPPEHARRFVERLRPLYAAQPERLDYLEFPDSGHFITDDEWRHVWTRTTDWFSRYLA